MINRRKFLQTATVAAGLAANPQARPLGAQQSNTDQHPRLRVGCCAYSYNKALRSGQMTLEDFIRKAVDLQVDGVDMTVYYLKSTDPAYLASLRHFAFQNAIPFSGAACGASMVQADKAKRAQVLDDIKKWVDVTDQLGASHLRIFGGSLPKGATTEQGIAWCIEVMKPASDYAGNRGITLGIEDHQGVTQNADEILEVIHAVDSPFARINLDIANFIATPKADEYAQIEACIPYASMTHIRDQFGSGGPIDLDRVWQMFAKAGYKGYMSAEFEDTKEDAMTGVPKLIANMRKLCSKYSPA